MWEQIWHNKLKLQSFINVEHLKNSKLKIKIKNKNPQVYVAVRYAVFKDIFVYVSSCDQKCAFQVILAPQILCTSTNHHNVLFSGKQAYRLSGNIFPSNSCLFQSYLANDVFNHRLIDFYVFLLTPDYSISSLFYFQHSKITI